MSMSVDPRLIERTPGVRGMIGDFRARISQGDLGTLPVIVGLAIVWIYFQIRNDNFTGAENLTNLTLQMADVGTISVGVVLILLLGEIDLSVGAVSGFAAASMVVLHVRHDWNPWLAIAAAIVVGAMVGMLHGVWVTLFRVPAFLVTLAGLLAWQGALLWVLGRQGSINITNPDLLRVANTFYGTGITWIVAASVIAIYAAAALVGRQRRLRAELPTPSVGRSLTKVGLLAVAVIVVALVFNADRGLPLAVCILVTVVVLYDMVLRRTRFGRHVYAVGGNVEAARRAGINVQRVKLIVFVLASATAALGGVLSASRNFSVSQSSGSNDVLLYSIAGAVIGGTSLFGGRGTAWSAFLGALVIGSILNGMTLLTIDSDIRFLVTGTVLLLAATIDAVSRRGRASAGRA